MSRWFIGGRPAAALLLLFAPVVLPAQSASTHAALLGEWKADLARSASAPTLVESMLLTVAQRGDTMVLVQRTARAGGAAQVATTRFFLDGKSVDNLIGPAGQEAKVQTTATWDGKVLAITTSGDVQGMEFNQQRQYRLDKGGKELASSVSSRIGGMRNDQEILFVQAPASGTPK